MPYLLCKGTKINPSHLWLSFVLLACLACFDHSVFAQTAPYSPSPVIESISWDFNGLTRAAIGSDLFPLTWSDDDNLYTSWGDGWGFGGLATKQLLGVSRLSGGPTDYVATDLWTEVGKSNGGIISIDGALYLYVQEQNVWTRAKLWKSTDHGLNWADLGWIFDEPGGAFASPGLIQFGQDYQGARDTFVYGYNHAGFTDGLGLFRVPKDQLGVRSAYEFVAGLDASDNPIWSFDINDRQPVFTDPNGVRWGVNAMYHPVLGRYLITVRHDDTGGWGIFDAPEPWGPWTTVAYYGNWIDSTTKFTFVFPEKWMSVDGKTMWMVFSGTGVYDSFNVIRATLTLSSATPPAPPTNLRIVIQP